MGVIIRDSTGGLFVAHSFVPHLVDAPMAEAYALKEGLMLDRMQQANHAIRLYGGRGYKGWRSHGEFGSRTI